MYKYDAQDRHAELRAALRERLAWPTTYPLRRAIGQTLRAMPDGENCPRQWADWYASPAGARRRDCWGGH